MVDPERVEGRDDKLSLGQQSGFLVCWVRKERGKGKADGDGWFFVLFCWVLFGHVAACVVLVP